MRDVLLLAMTFSCSFVALWRPFVGLAAFVFYGFFAPQTWVWSVARELPHSQIIGGCTILGYLFSSGPKRFPVQRETVLMAMLWGTFGVSTVFAFDSAAAFQQLILVSKMFLMVFLSASIVNNQRRLHILLRVMTVALGLYGLKGGLFFLRTGGEGMVELPVGSFLSANNSLGLALVVNLPLLFYLVRVEAHRWLRPLFQAMLILSYPAIVGTFSRGAWIAAAVVTLLLFWNTKRKAILLIGGALIAALVMTLFPAVPASIFSDRVVSRYETLVNVDEDPSSQSRLWSWEFCKRVGQGNPLIGAGFNYYSREAYAKYYPDMLARWPGKQWSCHSIWFTVLSEHGIVGFLLWIGLLISCFLSLREIRLHARGMPEARSIVALANTLKASLLGFIIGGTFLDFAYFDGYYEIVAVIIIIKEIMYRFKPGALVAESIGLTSGRKLAMASAPSN